MHLLKKIFNITKKKKKKNINFFYTNGKNKAIFNILNNIKVYIKVYKFLILKILIILRFFFFF